MQVLPWCPSETYKKSDYIETESGNKVNRQAIISGSQNIVLGGKTIIKKGCIIRGDLKRATSGSVAISIGRYCFFSESCILRPSCKTYKGVFSYYPMKIGDYVHVGEKTLIEASSIGNCVYIGKNCVIGKFTTIKDCALILDDSVLAPNTIVPPFSVYGGNPATFITELPETFAQDKEFMSRNIFYSKFMVQK